VRAGGGVKEVGEGWGRGKGREGDGGWGRLTRYELWVMSYMFNVVEGGCVPRGLGALLGHIRLDGRD